MMALSVGAALRNRVGELVPEEESGPNSTAPVWVVCRMRKCAGNAWQFAEK
jgi:hypothetical protein